jgi:hypothetical protein
MKRGKIEWYLVFFVLFAVCGYMREFFFVHMNNILFMKYYNKSSALKVPELMKTFEHFDYNTLYYSKYLFTILWVLLFFTINYYALRKLSSVSAFRRALLYCYAGMILLAGVAMAFGYLINGSLKNDEYTLSRWLMGVAQSPIICLILLASEKLYYKSEST